MQWKRMGKNNQKIQIQWKNNREEQLDRIRQLDRITVEE